MKENSENRPSKQTKQTKLCWKTPRKSGYMSDYHYRILLGVYPQYISKRLNNANH